MIVTYEGQAVHNSLIDAIVAQEIRRQKDARLAEALAAKKQAEDESELMRRAYQELWQEKIDDANEKYQWNPDHGSAYRLMAGAAALVVLAFAALFEWIESGGQSAPKGLSASTPAVRRETRAPAMAVGAGRNR